MTMYDLILKKRNGEKLTADEINFIIEGYCQGEIPDYQISALLMAIYFQGMDKEETIKLTRAMKASGEVMNLSMIEGIKVDKHSTGGVGDKTTLIVGPIVASCGVPVAKMSGRGLGFTGGTVDKMESIPGFKTSLKPEEFINLVNKSKIAIIGQSGQIAKADKLLYALRDVTATVDNLSLIASSVMSKKLASGSDAIVLDVKCGNGAFMSCPEEATKLGQIMVDIGQAEGKNTVALITDMNQPLGLAVGNSLEIMEVIDVLKDKGPSDIKELSIELAGVMIYLGKKASSLEEGRQMAADSITSGKALEKFKEFIQGQGGDSNVIVDYSLFPKPEFQLDVVSNKSGYVNLIKADEIGIVSRNIGAGRAYKEDEIDLSAGIILECKEGDKVKDGQVIAVLQGNDLDKLKSEIGSCQKAFVIKDEINQSSELIIKTIGL